MLNPEQQQAVDQIDGPVMVLAGPGTGKTQILAARIESILAKTQLDPHNILCLTFTESGVVAMRERLLKRIGTAAYFVSIHTFHSFCNSLILENSELFAETRELEPLSDLERVQILRSILKTRPLRSPWVPFEDPYQFAGQLSSAISTLKREDVTPEKLDQVLQKLQEFMTQKGEAIETLVDIHGNSFSESQGQELFGLIQNTPLDYLFSLNWDIADKKNRTAFKKAVKEDFLSMQKHLPKQRALQEIYSSFEQELRSRGRYDFEDMILFVIKKLREDSWLLARHQERYQYILVDEYQDTNGAQNELLELLTTHHELPNLFVVGDDKQSIYRFQGASLENILYFHKRFKDELTLVSLQQNYRSTQTILDASHSLIEKQPMLAAQALGTELSHLQANAGHPETKLEVWDLETVQEEHYALAKKVQDLIASGTEPQEIAVLLRENREVENLEELFLRMQIPVCVEAGKNILKDPFIRNVIHTLEAVADPHSDEKLYRALQWGEWGIDQLTLIKFIIQVRSRKKPLLEKLTEEEGVLADWANKIVALHQASFERTFSDFFEHFLRESGLLAAIAKKPDELEILNRLSSLYDQFKTWNRGRHELTLQDALDNLALMQEHDLKLEENSFATASKAVRLMTAHKSKGLEFDVVFIPHVVDTRWGNRRQHHQLKFPPGLLQNDRYANVDDQNDDERRLFYVAITRAKKTLILSHSKLNEADRPQSPSQFLSEIGEAFLETPDLSAVQEEARQNYPRLIFQPVLRPLTELKDVVAPLLENYSLSVTHLNSYLKCPRRFFYENLVRVPRAKNKSAAFGTAIHAALQDLHEEHRKDEFPGVQFLLDRFDHHLEKEVLLPADHDASKARGHEVLEAFYEHNHTHFSRLVRPEFNFASHHVEVEGVPITGKLDLIELIEENGNAVKVIDYKTGKAEYKNEELKIGGDYHRQIVFYQLLCNNSRRFPYQMVSGEMAFVEPQQDGSFRTQSYKVSKEELDRVLTEAKSVYDDIKNLRFLELQPDEGCGECEYCLGNGGR